MTRCRGCTFELITHLPSVTATTPMATFTPNMISTGLPQGVHDMQPRPVTPGCRADLTHLLQRDLPLQHSADHDAIMVDLAPNDDCGHYDSGNNDKDNVTDTTVTARNGDMTDGALYLTSTTRKDILHDPGTGLGGLDRAR